MGDLGTQLRTYYDTQVRETDPASIVVGRQPASAFEPEPGPRAPWWRSPALVAAGAALTTLVFLGGTVLLTSNGSNDAATTSAPPTTAATTTTLTPTTTAAAPPTTVPPTTTTGAPSTTVAPTTTTEAAPPVYEPITAIEATVLEPGNHPGSGHVMLAVVSAPSGLVAVGDAAGSMTNEMSDGGVWLSEDGSEWTRLDADGLFESGGASLRTIAHTGDRFVVGGSSCDTEERCPFAPAFWTSTNGITWARVADDSAIFGEGGGVGDIVVADDRLLASGMACGGPTADSVPLDGEECRPTVWSSPEGLVWDRVWAGDTFATIEAIAVGPTSMVGVGFEQLVDSDGTPTGDWVGAAWASGDGITWTRLASDVGGSAVAFGPNGFVAVGDDGIDAVVWVSPDGYAWSLVEDPTFADGTMTDVIATDDGYIAVGPVWGLDPEVYGGPFPGLAPTVQPPIVWTSPDGRAWERHPFDGDGIGSLRAATVVDGTLVLVGQRGDFDGEAAAWTVDLG